MSNIKIEKIDKKQKILLISAIMTIGIVVTLVLITSKAKYKNIQSIDLASGTINYTPYDFKLMAMYKSDDGNNYIEIEKMPISDYVVNEEKSYCTIDGKTQIKGKIKTLDGNHVISNLEKNDKCYVWFDKKKTPSEKTLSKLNITNVKTTVPDFNQVATTDEGIYEVEDGMYEGTSYYWRGSVTNNYVSFANKCWRIVRINGDGSLRLIYDGTTCHANGENTLDSLAIAKQVYSPSCDKSEYVGWVYSIGYQRTLTGTESKAKTQTDNWYISNIGNNAMYSAKVTDGKFCNDRNTASGYSWSSHPSSTFYYAAYARIITNKQPTLSCDSGDVFILKAGAITADEVMYAGGGNTANNQYYLCNGQYYWTMSPYHWWYLNSVNIYARVFSVRPDGSFENTNMNYDRGLRPVINLRADTEFTGSGSSTDPFVVV